MRVISVYRSPKYPARRFLDIVTEVLLALDKTELKILMGDMNFDLKDPNNEYVIQELAALGLEIILPATTSTTDNNTHLDACYSNSTAVQAGVYECYYSLHKGLSIHWNLK